MKYSSIDVTVYPKTRKEYLRIQKVLGDKGFISCLYEVSFIGRKPNKIVQVVKPRATK